MSNPDELTTKTGLRTLMALSDADARTLLEQMRWPTGPICPHCGVLNEASRVVRHKDTAKTREGLWVCLACHEQFSVTVGTVMEGSHIPLGKWMAAIHILCSSKKSVSALQLQRQLELGSYRTAWHLCHRVRHMMANTGPQPPMSGDVEADETYVGGKPRHHTPQEKNKHTGRGTKKTAVQVLVMRGGAARARAVGRVDGETLIPFIREHAHRSSRVHTDEFLSYRGVGKHFEGGHHVVKHGTREYVRGNAHTNTAESFNGLFKRAVMGSWHSISKEHIDRYLDEQCFRWSHRFKSDWERTQRAVAQAHGVRLYYKQPRRQGEQGGEGLVANG
jgi:hypothetical protein